MVFLEPIQLKENFIIMVYNCRTYGGDNMKTKSTLISMVFQDLKRGIKNKRFWMILIVMGIMAALTMVFDGVWAVQKVKMGVAPEEFDGVSFTARDEIDIITGSGLFVYYMPFLAAIAYSYSIMDDWKHGYYHQIVQRCSMKKYFWSRFISNALLGGILLVLIYAVIVGVAELGITYNPFLRDVVDYYTNTESYKVSYNASIRWGRHILCDSLNYVAWRLLGCVQFFGMGVLYGAISGVIAFMTSNRVLVYAAPVLILGLWEKWLYAVILLFQKNEMVTETLRYFFIKPYVGSFGYLILYGFLVFLIVLVLCIAKVLEPKIMERYREGGSER